MTFKKTGTSRFTAMLLCTASAVTLSTHAIPAAGAQDDTAPDGQTACTPSDTIAFIDAYDRIVDELAGDIPAELKGQFDTNADAMRGAIVNTDVAYVDVSRQASAINETAEENADPYANFAVSRLDKIRNGDASARVAVEDLTLGEVTETIVLGLYTFTVPLETVAQSVPAIGPVPGLEGVATLPLIGSYATIGGLAKLPLQYGAQGIRALADVAQNQLANTCWKGEDAPSDEERLSGGANPVVPVQPAERGKAAAMELGENCTPASQENISQAIDRAADGVRPQVPAGQEGAFDAEVARLQANAANARITDNFIPRDAEEINPVLALVENPLLNFAAGAITGDMTRSTAVADLTIGNSVDYAYIVEALTSLIIGEVWGATVPSTPNPVNGRSYTSVPNFPNAASYLTTTGLGVYENVTDTMCLTGTEDE
ncbi:MAG: hypothetical protein ACTIL2_14725 [Corynebacterium sp.]|uniref:hypothetical protein n=1 Tax=Corynebacterium sp. TaxID=1720 RepID=UPI003F973855